jgi:hypothetical protein
MKTETTKNRINHNAASSESGSATAIEERHNGVAATAHFKAKARELSAGQEMADWLDTEEESKGIEEI